MVREAIDGDPLHPPGTVVPAEPRVAPTFVALYDADWIVPPKVATWNRSPAECGLGQD